MCPDTVVFQTDWNPEAEHGQLYHMVGDGSTIDTAKSRVTGPLVSGGKDTGVKVEVRSGGPAIGFQTVTSQLYADPDMLLGYVSTDEADLQLRQVPDQGGRRTVQHQPADHHVGPGHLPERQDDRRPEGHRRQGPLLRRAAYMDYLIQSGQLDKNQIDGSYDGTPANFVADGGKSAQQGFVSAEPYFYEKVLKDWVKPIAFQLIHDAGWTSYAQALATTPDNVTKNAACFKKLVPIIQQSQVDYVKSPDKTERPRSSTW